MHQLFASSSQRITDIQLILSSAQLKKAAALKLQVKAGLLTRNCEPFD